MDSSSFPVKFMTPTSEEVVDVTWISFETASGNRVVQKGHSPLLARLQANHAVSYETADKKTHTIMLNGGIVKVERNAVTVIVDE